MRTPSQMAASIIENYHGRLITHAGLQSILEIELENWFNDCKKEAYKQTREILKRLEDMI